MSLVSRSDAWSDDWADSVAAALTSDRIALALQPVLQARSTGRVAFHEALLRLILPNGEVVPAGAFLPSVESLPAGRMLDRRALALALDHLAATPALRLSVNLSALGVTDPVWEWALDAALDRDPTLADRLIVEITETAAAENAGAVAAFVRRWQGAGVSFAIDDFGVGQTALRHLRDIRFDIVKIDGSFTSGIDRDRDNQAIVTAITGLARHFDAMVVAERVETAAEAAWLAEHGIDALQGYHFGRPQLCQLPIAMTA